MSRNMHGLITVAAELRAVGYPLSVEADEAWVRPRRPVKPRRGGSAQRSASAW